MVQSIEEVMSKLQERARIAQTQSVKSDDSDQGKYDCEVCKDKGRYLKRKQSVNPFSNEPEFFKDGSPIMHDVMVECECFEKINERKHIQKLMKSSEITEEFRKLGFGNFTTEGKSQLVIDAYECALEYYQSFDQIKGNRQNSIALLGQPGSGKTHLLTAIANNLIQKKKVQVFYFPYVEGFNDLKNDFDVLEEKTVRMKSSEVLFIDDLFKPARKKPRATEWQVEQMYGVINHRYLNHKPILVSSELSVDEIMNIDEALATRIHEMCKDFELLIKGDPNQLNYRLR